MSKSSEFHYTIEPKLVGEEIRYDIVEWHMPEDSCVNPSDVYRHRVSDTQQAHKWIAKRKYTRRRLDEAHEIYGGMVL